MDSRIPAYGVWHARVPLRHHGIDLVPRGEKNPRTLASWRSAPEAGRETIIVDEKGLKTRITRTVPRPGEDYAAAEMRGHLVDMEV